MTKIDVLDEGYVRYVDHMGSDLSVVNAARVSYAKESAEFSDKDERLINFLVRNKEYSPFRHAALTFEIYAPLFVARQWWKYTVLQILNFAIEPDNFALAALHTDSITSSLGSAVATSSITTLLTQ